VIFWIDAQLPPQLASWLSQTFKVEAYALRDLQLRDAEDEQIFQKARQQGIVLISKDSDSSSWCAFGYASATALRDLRQCHQTVACKIFLTQVFLRALELLVSGEAIVEIADLEKT